MNTKLTLLILVSALVTFAGCKPTPPEVAPKVAAPVESKPISEAVKEPAPTPEPAPKPEPPPDGALKAGNQGKFWQSLDASGERKAGDRIRIAPTEDIAWSVNQSRPLTVSFFLHDKEGVMKEGDTVRATAFYSSKEANGKGATTFIGIPPDKAILKKTDDGFEFPAEIRMYTPVSGEGEIQLFIWDTAMGSPISNIISLRVQAQ